MMCDVCCKNEGTQPLFGYIVCANCATDVRLAFLMFLRGLVKPRLPAMPKPAPKDSPK